MLILLIMSVRKVRKMSQSESAYLAGLVDGEGTITLTSKRKDAFRVVSLTISSTEPALLKWARRTIGAGIITGKRTVSEKHTPSFTYQIYSRQALDVIAQIQPHLQSYKKRRAKFVLNHYLNVTPRNGKYSEKLLNKRNRFISKFFTITAN